MLGRRFISFFKGSQTSTYANIHSSAKSASDGKAGSFTRKAVAFVLITVTGGVAFSTLDYLSIYHACRSKAMEKVIKNQAMMDAIGEPIEKGSWLNGSLGVAHNRRAMACSFPVKGPQGSGIVYLRAVRNGEDSLFAHLRPRNWEILIMEALVHVPSNEGPQQTLRINIYDAVSLPLSAWTDRKPSAPEEPAEKS